MGHPAYVIYYTVVLIVLKLNSTRGRPEKVRTPTTILYTHSAHVCTHFFGQQVERDAGLVVLHARHGNLAVEPRVPVGHCDVAVYYGADSRVFGHGERVRPAQELGRVVVDVHHGYLSPQ